MEQSFRYLSDKGWASYISSQSANIMEDELILCVALTKGGLMAQDQLLNAEVVTSYP